MKQLSFIRTPEELSGTVRGQRSASTRRTRSRAKAFQALAPRSR